MEKELDEPRSGGGASPFLKQQFECARRSDPSSGKWCAIMGSYRLSVLFFKIVIMKTISATAFTCLPLYSTSCAVLLILGCGACVGYSAIMLPQLQDEGGNIEINPSTSSWIASMPGIPLPFASVLGGWCIEKFGRRRTHQLMSLPITVGWLIIALSNDLTWILVGRFLCGVSMGGQAAVSSVYIGEAASPAHRSFFLSFIATAVIGGVFISHLLGTFYHWKTVAAVCSLFPFACGVLVTFAPETPSWLVSKTRVEKATKSFVWYRGYSVTEMKELNAMIEKKKKFVTEEQESTRVKKWDEMKKREFILPMILMCNFFILLQFSGNNVVNFYSIQIIRESMGTGMNEYAVMLGLDTIRLISSIAACVILNKCRRRTAALSSGFFTFLSLISLAIFLYLCKHNYVPPNLTWLTLLFLSFYMVSMSMGVFPLPWSLLGEIFPLRLRSLGVSISTFFTSTLYFLAAKTAPYMFDSWGMPGTFCFYAVITLFCVCVIYKFLPETRGKTLQEIEEYFTRGHRPSFVEKK